MFSQRTKHSFEILTICLYASLLSVVSYFHEPWFDEAQAWLIARDSSLFDMIWNVLRYEGHTPLWYLSLFIPAHMGIPFELGLKSINFVFAVLAAATFIKYAPFPLVVRILTPFTYFLFYQYGVISRCYSLFMLILWLIAAVFPRRNERPLLFSVLLALLGGITAYGMLIAFGIALAWLIEITIKYRKNAPSFFRALANTVSDKRFHSLILLGVLNVFYVAILWPMPDRHTPQYFDHITAGEILYRFISVPVGSLFWGENPEAFSNSDASAYSIYIAVIGLCLIAILFIWAVRNKIFNYVFFPYVILNLFISFIYFSPHHSGLYTLLTIFLVWITEQKRDEFKPPQRANKINNNFYKNRKYKLPYKEMFITCLAFFFIIQIYWSFSASMNDMRYPYSPYRDLALFVKNNKLSGENIFDYYYVYNGINSYYTKNNAMLAYFPDNIFYNHNFGRRSIGYATHRKMDDNTLMEYLKSAGLPDFILWNNRPLPFYHDFFSLSDYVPIKSFIGYYMWKDLLAPESVVCYIRKDLLEQYTNLSIQPD